MSVDGGDSVVHDTKVTQAIVKHIPDNKTTTHGQGVICPRCGEMLMPGANICEFCGEVIYPVVPVDDRETNSVLYKAAEEEDSLPAIIRSSTTVASPRQTVPMPTQPEDHDKGKDEKDGQVSLTMLIIICVLVAGIACCITWAVIHFNREDKKSADEVELVEETDDIAMTGQGIGSAEAAEPQPTSMPSFSEQPKMEEPAPSQNRNTASNVPIEGMRESLAGSYTFHGKVNGKFTIGIDMTVKPDGQITGCYWYDSTLRKEGDVPSTFINLNGDVDDTGKVTLEAQKYGESRPTEHWTGTLSGVQNILFKGSFRNASKGTTYSFNVVAHNPHYQ